MSSAAIIMLVIATVTVWGGLVLAVINIKRSPEEVDELDPEEADRPHAYQENATVM